MMPATLFMFWGATAAAGIAFLGFAWMFVAALNEGAGNYSDQMGAQTSREFEDVFMFLPPAKIARLGRIVGLGDGLLRDEWQSKRRGHCEHKDFLHVCSPLAVFRL